jgi:FixJ family two-component response regulator
MAQGLPVIVLVEDDDGLRGALVSMLSVRGFTVHAFATGESARDTAPWDRAACLVADIRLPGISGLDLVQWLQSSGHQVPAIAMTAAPNQHARSLAKTLGVQAFLEKPVVGNVLVAAIQQAIAP